MLKTILAAGIAMELMAGSALADLNSLAQQGYVVLETTYVAGAFKGSKFNLRIPLQDGVIFVCSGIRITMHMVRKR